MNTSDGWAEGVKTLDGKDVVPLSVNTSMYLVTSKKTGDVFIMKSSYNESGSGESFAVIDRDGKTVLSGEGYATFSEQLDLFTVYGGTSFGYADTRGNYIFRISLLQYVPD